MATWRLESGGPAGYARKERGPVAAAAHRVEIHGERRLDPDPARDRLQHRADARNGLPPGEVAEDGDDEEGGNDDDAEPEPDGGASHAARIASSARPARRNVL